MSSWQLVDRPSDDVRVIGCRFVYKTKWMQDHVDDCSPQGRKAEILGTKAKGFVVKQFKARLVAQGYNLVEGLDYKSSYAGVLGTDSARALACIGSFYGLYFFTLDFSNFYLTGKLDHDVYMEQPPGFEVESRQHTVCLLNGALY